MGTFDSKRLEIEEYLIKGVRDAQAGFDATVLTRASRAERLQAARELQTVTDHLLDYVMRDILPPYLKDKF